MRFTIWIGRGAAWLRRCWSCGAPLGPRERRCPRCGASQPREV